MLTGVSGVGKTTLAKRLSKEFDIPFVSGSYSDLVPETTSMPHQAMMAQSIETIQAQDFKVINLRHKSVKGLHSYISDRSYVDSLGYWLFKLSGQVSECQSTDFIEQCGSLLELDTDVIIYIPYTTTMVDGGWVMENNDKRILSKWFQFQLSAIMDGVFSYLDPKASYTIYPHQESSDTTTIPSYVACYGTMKMNTKDITVISLHTTNFEERVRLVKEILEFIGK